MFKNSHKFCNYIRYKNDSIILDKKSLVNLIYFQTLKKWIYSTYSGNEIENILIGEKYLDKSDKSNKSTLDNFDNLILIDNTTSNISRIKKINSDKIDSDNEETNDDIKEKRRRIPMRLARKKKK